LQHAYPLPVQPVTGAGFGARACTRCAGLMASWHVELRRRDAPAMSLTSRSLMFELESQCETDTTHPSAHCESWNHVIQD